MDLKSIIVWIFIIMVFHHVGATKNTGANRVDQL